MDEITPASETGKIAGTDFSEANRPQAPATPFDDEDIQPSQRATLLGIHIKNPLKTLGEAYGRLSREQKQNVMYLMQGTAATCLLAGGIVGMVTGTAPALISAGLITTGALNGLRSAVQFAVRRWRAKSPGSNSKTEMGNSILSGLTNAPQAASGSSAAITAVLTYALRAVNYSLENDALKDGKAVAKADPANNNAFENHDVENTSATHVGAVRKTTSFLCGSFNRCAVNTGKLIQKLPGGDKVLTRGPGYIMTGRGVLQTVEGCIMALTVGLGAGLPVLTAGGIYVAAATVMKDSDSKGATPAPPQEPVKAQTQVTQDKAVIA